MSVIFLEELFLSGVDGSGSSPHEVSNMPPLKLSNIHERSTVPGPIGVLPRDHFIYILIGILVFLCCYFALWDIFEAIKSPRRYLKTIRSETTAFVASPYREKRPATPGKVNAMTRWEVAKLRSEQEYQSAGLLGASLAAKPNLPIPVMMGIWDAEQPGTGIDAHAIEAWALLVREKETLNVLTANLERLDQARQQAGQPGTTNPRLLGALQRRAEVGILINSTFEKFKEARADWSAEEWQVVELIMQHSD